jgi:hypothetical protein
MKGALFKSAYLVRRQGEYLFEVLPHSMYSAKAESLQLYPAYLANENSFNPCVQGRCQNIHRSVRLMKKCFLKKLAACSF